MKAPAYEVDLYSDDCIQDPWPIYAEMRELGPVVWLPQHECFALTQLKEVRAALRDHARFSSRLGVAGDQFGCDYLQGNTVASDQPRHTQLRDIMAPPLKPNALEPIRPQIENVANELIEDLCKRDGFDVVTDLAQHLPLVVVRELVGLPDFGRSNMLKWASAAFNVLGVQNERGRAAIGDIEEMRKFVKTGITSETLKPGSWTKGILEMVERGELDAELAPFAIRDFMNPSLDTTISAMGQMLWQLGRNPDQWEKLKENPSTALNAVHEAVRLATPIRMFSRQTTQNMSINNVDVPQGARVMMMFASANRDERMFENPDKFDISRNNRMHVGFGAGIHMCVGMHLALMEMSSILSAMIEQVDDIEVGTPTVAMNNTICAFSELPAKFHGLS